MEEALKKIKELCEAPRWVNGRRITIHEIATKALIQERERQAQAGN